MAVIPCLRDNYAYALLDRATKEAVVIDPSEAEPVSAFLATEGFRVRHLLATHHHPDHVGGAVALAAAHQTNLVAHDVDAERLRVAGVPVRGAGEGSLFAFGGATFDLVHVPGHTLGAACFVVREAGALPRLFTGDTLFLGGCGRIFEGTPSMMRASLERIATLADEALVFCGHEYTATNLAFACEVEPSNPSVRAALDRARVVSCTVPGRITVERSTNPFLRTAHGARFALPVGLAATTPDELFASLRSAKNSFRAP